MIKYSHCKEIHYGTGTMSVLFDVTSEPVGIELEDYQELALKIRQGKFTGTLLQKSKGRIDPDALSAIAKFQWNKKKGIYLCDLPELSVRMTENSKKFEEWCIFCRTETPTMITTQVGKVVYGDVKFGNRVIRNGKTVVEARGENAVNFSLNEPQVTVTRVKHEAIASSEAGAAVPYGTRFLNIYFGDVKQELDPRTLVMMRGLGLIEG
jgi:hypothetical protein